MERVGQIVRSLAGCDKGKLMVIVGVDENGLLLLANGRDRKLEAPKKKKEKHAAPVEKAGRLPAEQMLTNRGIRQALRRVETFLATEKG